MSSSMAIRIRALQRRSWRTHSCAPCRDSSRHVFAPHIPSVGASADVARASACATLATVTKCQAILARTLSAALLLMLAGCARREAPEIRIAVGGAEQLVYLPTTLAQQLGFYEAEGVRVKLESFPGGAKSLQALLGGSADVVSGFYDHTLQMAAEGRKLKAFALMLHYPGMAVVVSPQKSGAIHRMEDLKGAVVGVTAPGSSTHMLINYLLVKHGLTPGDISAVGIGGGAGAAAAVEHGKVDAAVVTDPVLTQLLKRNPNLRILADARQAAGVKDIFGTETYPASVFYSTTELI